jgi:hypothetical protein
MATKAGMDYVALIAGIMNSAKVRCRRRTLADLMAA